MLLSFVFIFYRFYFLKTVVGKSFFRKLEDSPLKTKKSRGAAKRFLKKLGSLLGILFTKTELKNEIFLLYGQQKVWNFFYALGGHGAFLGFRDVGQ